MKILKIAGIALLLAVLLVLGAYAWAFHTATTRYEKQWTAHDTTFPIPFPLDSAEIQALRVENIEGGANPEAPLAGVDLAAVARDQAVKRGEHLVQSRLGCNGCHGEDFGGHVIIDVPLVGYWAAPNLTSGAGSVTNGFGAHDWDLAVRHGIRHTGQSSSMPSNDLLTVADHELSDVICYIKSQPPVDRHIAPVRLGPVFSFLVAGDPKMLAAYGIDHQKPHAVEPPPAAVTAEYGEHLVQGCKGCHNPKLSGGKVQGDPNMPIVANITPDPTGIKGWTEADFLRAMRDGKRPDGTDINPAMPWKSFGKMYDVELKALWAYLQTVPAVPKGQK